MIELVKRGNLTADEHAYLELLGTLADAYEAKSKEIRDRELCSQYEFPAQTQSITSNT